MYKESLKYTWKYTRSIQGNKAKREEKTRKPLLTTQPINEIENGPWSTIYIILISQCPIKQFYTKYMNCISSILINLESFMDKVTILLRWKQDSLQVFWKNSKINLTTYISSITWTLFIWYLLQRNYTLSCIS